MVLRLERLVLRFYDMMGLGMWMIIVVGNVMRVRIYVRVHID